MDEFLRELSINENFRRTAIRKLLVNAVGYPVIYFILNYFLKYRVSLEVFIVTYIIIMLLALRSVWFAYENIRDKKAAKE